MCGSAIAKEGNCHPVALSLSFFYELEPNPPFSKGYLTTANVKTVYERTV
jgi:hypothetical protein